MLTPDELTDLLDKASRARRFANALPINDPAVAQIALLADELETEIFRLTREPE